MSGIIVARNVTKCALSVIQQADQRRQLRATIKQTAGCKTIRAVSPEFNRLPKELIILIVPSRPFLETTQQKRLDRRWKSSRKYLVSFAVSFRSIFIEARSVVRNFLEQDYSTLFIVNLEERERQAKEEGRETDGLIAAIINARHRTSETSFTQPKHKLLV